MSSCLCCFLPPSPHCFNGTHFHEASIKTTRDQFGLSLTAEETLDGYRRLKLLSPKERGRFYPNCSSPSGSHSRSEPQRAASSASRYWLLQHLEIRKRFTHRKPSQRMTLERRGFHSALLVSKPVLWKAGEHLPGLSGHMPGTRRSAVPCKADGAHSGHGRPLPHGGHHPVLCTTPLLVLPAPYFGVRQHRHAHDTLICTALHLPPVRTLIHRLGKAQVTRREATERPG